MTTSATPILRICAATLAFALAAAGCDDGAVINDDQAPVRFRDGDGTWGPGKLNTNFIGIDEKLPLNAIPLVDDPAAEVRLHAVWTDHCVDRRVGKSLTGLFYTSNLDGALGIDVTDGDLDAATFKMWKKPWITCTVAGNEWEHTVWAVITTKGGKSTNHYLMILDRGVDTLGNPVYEWGYYTGIGDLFNPSSYGHTCLEDQDPYADPLHRFHAHLIADLGVESAPLRFVDAPDTIFLACLSGAVGKTASARWGYAPWTWGTDVHELATHVAIADYCGDGTAYTQAGNKLTIRDQWAINGYAPVAWEDEAAWDMDTMRATCLTLPRDHAMRNGFTHLECDGVPLPHCDDTMMAAAPMATRLID